MFDLGFGELLLTAVIALLVLGPERLPRAARMAGLWMRRARASWYSVRAQFERELADDELKRSLQATRKEFDGLRDDLQRPLTLDAPRPATPAGDANEASSEANGSDLRPNRSIPSYPRRRESSDLGRPDVPRAAPDPGFRGDGGLESVTFAPEAGATDAPGADAVPLSQDEHRVDPPHSHPRGGP